MKHLLALFFGALFFSNCCSAEPLSRSKLIAGVVDIESDRLVLMNGVVTAPFDTRGSIDSVKYDRSRGSLQITVSYSEKSRGPIGVICTILVYQEIEPFDRIPIDKDREKELNSKHWSNVKSSPIWRSRFNKAVGYDGTALNQDGVEFRHRTIAMRKFGKDFTVKNACRTISNNVLPGLVELRDEVFILTISRADEIDVVSPQVR